MKTNKGGMEMDELKLKLSTNYMRGIISKLIKKALYNKLGYNIDILLNEIEVKNDGDMICIHVDADTKISTHDFSKIIKSVIED